MKSILASTNLSRRHFLQFAGVTIYAGMVNLRSPKLLSVKSNFQITGPEVSALLPFDTTMTEFMQQRSIPCAALAVTYQGRLVFARGYTSEDTSDEVTQPTSLFRVASLTKPLTAAAIMILVQKGKLSLDAYVTDLIQLSPPSGQTADARLGDVTVRHLLQHTGGWDRNLAPDPTWNDRIISQALGVDYPLTTAHIMTYTTGQPLQHDPGTTFAYCNYGYLLLGEIIEQISSQSYEQFILQYILDPLGIYRMRLGESALSGKLPSEVVYHSLYTRTSVIDNSGDSVPFPYGGFNLDYQRAQGGWVASTVDLLRFANAFDSQNNSTLFLPETIELIFAQPSIGPEGNGRWYGLGWFVRNAGTSRNTWHDGSQPGSSTLMVRRWDGISWVVMFNQREDSSDPNGQSYWQIDDDLHAAANQVTSWPDHDFFPEFLPELTQKVYLPTVLAH